MEYDEVMTENFDEAETEELPEGFTEEDESTEEPVEDLIEGDGDVPGKIPARCSDESVPVRQSRFAHKTVHLLCGADQALRGTHFGTFA